MKLDFNTAKIHWFDLLASTNKYAEEMLSSGRPEQGTMIVAEAQTHGRGMGENKWESEPGKNILVSIILYPDFLPAENQFLLNKVVSLAVLRCVKHFLPLENVSVKWPNDIYVGKSKIGGILIKNTISGNQIHSCIVGIGLNINQERYSKLLPNPVSMRQIIGYDTPLDFVISKLQYFLDEEYSYLSKGNLDELNDKYLNSLLNFNQPAFYKTGSEIIEGVICGVSSFGKLLLLTDRKTREFDLKEITFLFE